MNDDKHQLSLHDLMHAPEKAEHVLVGLSTDQLAQIEQTIRRAKKRKLEHRDDCCARPRTDRASHMHSNEPVVEVRDGVEWVSFVSSHNRVRRRYTIRTDVQTVSLDMLDDQFRLNNCVYPRANLPREAYRGNRWNYETECNRLGWKLAWLNPTEIAGKRGLIQRAVDSYRNRSPHMQSRRVARQAKKKTKKKCMDGSVRGRRNGSRELRGPPTPTPMPSPSASEDEDEDDHRTAFPTTLAAATVKSAHSPKTLVMVDRVLGRLRIKVHLESVLLDVIPQDFRDANTVFPRSRTLPSAENTSSAPDRSKRWIEETLCNELGWKLAWLNPRSLAGKKTLLQRAVDMYRLKFMPAFQPRAARLLAPPGSKRTMQQQPTFVSEFTPSSSPALAMESTALAIPSACLSPSATESSSSTTSFDEALLLRQSDLLPDATATTIDPCLIFFGSPFISPPADAAVPSYLDQSWYTLGHEHHPSISHYENTF
ncbi:hypothetical protein BX666DRAFT_1922416 [Dichotomocladium elegans]|nr:hypothetical protein BX666DRAFT_1922416 [Dichotomocladium elegans]